LDFSDLHRQIFHLPAGIDSFAPYFLEILKLLVDHTEGKNDAAVLKEIISFVYNSVEKLGQTVRDVMEHGKVTISPAVFIRLMRNYLGRLSAPFEGEPLSGVQVMGILETRCLDFRHLLIVGMNEDFWPGKDSLPSMIPFGIRRGFGLPGPDETEAMVSYYFYRLIQRAETVTMTWNTVRDGLTGGELSRYCYQLMMESPHTVLRINQELPIAGVSPLKIEVTSDPHSPGNFPQAGSEDNPLSPSAIIAFLTCSLKFYFRYVAGLKEADEVNEDITRQLFGNIFHKAIELVYAPLSGKLCDKVLFRELLGNREHIRSCIRAAFNTEYFGRKPEEREPVPLEGKSILIASTIETYILHILEADIQQAPILIHSLEKGYLTEISTVIDGRKRNITIGGKIDRIDELNGIIRVLDYKTGNVGNNATTFRSIQELFDTESGDVKKEVIQALIYSFILERTAFGGKDIRPAVLSVLKLKDAAFNPLIRMNGEPVVFEKVRDDLMTELEKNLSIIYSDSYHYIQTQETERCRFCPYRGLCGRW
jgi:CRISPR/Cas system-associated exonuclease Cas4 (RecB family)